MSAARTGYVTANGREIAIGEGWSVVDLVVSLEMDPRYVVVEHNGEALGREHFGDTTLADGDRVEIVRAVAGG